VIAHPATTAGRRKRVSDYTNNLLWNMQQEGVHKLCPMPREGGDSVYWYQCYESACAWWDELKQCCAVLTIARAARQK